jgi:uncharacterized protein YlxW (UPF0749 family)
MRNILLGFLALVLLCGVSVDISAQKKRKKAKQPLPMPTPVQTVEPAVVSRASDYKDDTPINPDAVPANEVSTAPQSVDEIPATTNPQVEALAQQVRDLTGKIDSINSKQKLLLDMQILTNAETRSENLHQKLIDYADKEAEIKSRLDQIEYEIRPDVIERNAAFIGSLRPEEVRENMRKKLQDEKDRLTAQINQIQTNRANLETSAASADAMVEKLRARLETDIDTISTAPAKKP